MFSLLKRFRDVLLVGALLLYPLATYLSSGHKGREVFEAYAESKTPAGYRIFWHYGPGKNRITVIAITPHP